MVFVAIHLPIAAPGQHLSNAALCGREPSQTKATVPVIKFQNSSGLLVARTSYVSVPGIE